MAGYAAVDRRDYDFVGRGYHEDAVFEFPEEDILHSPVGGRETFAETWRDEQDFWKKVTHRVDDIEELGDDRVLVEVLQSASGRSGIEVSQRLWHLYEYRGGKVARLRGFLSRSQALAAVGADTESA
jgi:ketosteroid isomerase-like protein